MRKLFFLLAALTIFPTLVWAQDDVPTFEVFGGYSYLRTGSGYDQNSHGWNASAAVNLTDHFALKADFAGHYDRYNVGAARVGTNLHTFLFGPQVNIRASERVNPFLHALFGAANDRINVNTPVGNINYGDTGFGMALGGGIDLKMTENLSWRLIQADYLLTRYSDPGRLPVQKRTVNHARISTGLVIH